VGLYVGTNKPIYPLLITLQKRGEKETLL